MRTKKREQKSSGLTEKKSIVSNEGTLVSKPFAPECKLLKGPVGRTLTLMALCVLVVVFPIPDAALASNPLGPEGASVSLGFEESYLLDKKTYVHRGVDVPGSAGAAVCAPCGGIVSYVGSVPAGDREIGSSSHKQKGATMKAVSIKIKGGKTVTLMPFSAYGVEVGQTVQEGTVLGTLAQNGDRSSSKPHLHIGLKKDGEYFDPSFLLGTAIKENKTTGQDEVLSPRAGSNDAPIQAAAANQASETNETEGNGAAQGARPYEEVNAKEPKASEESFGAISSGKAKASYELPVEKSGLQECVDGAIGLLTGIQQACLWQARELNEGIVSFAQENKLPLLAVYLFLVMAAVAMVAALLFGLVQVAHKIGIKRKIKTSLYGADGGDNMGKLFPVPGTTFMTRGR